MDNQKVGAFIATRRKALGMTQRALAEQLHVTNKAISKWETGAGFPDVGSLEPLAAALEVSVVELLHGEQLDSYSVSEETAREAVAQVVRTAAKAEQQDALTSLVTLLAVPLVVCLLWVLRIPGLQPWLLRCLPWVFGGVGVVATIRALWRWSRSSTLLRTFLSATAVTVGLFSASAINLALLLLCMIYAL